MATTGSSQSQPVKYDQRDADHHADRGPDVGHQVLRVGLQRDRAVLLARARTCTQASRPLSAELTTDSARPQPTCSIGWGSKHPVRRPPRRCRAAAAMISSAFETRRKVFGLVVPVGMVFVGRARGDRHHHQREDGAGQVDEGLHRVRQQADRIGDVPGQRLERDGDDGNHHGGHEQALRRQEAGGGRRHGPIVAQPKVRAMTESGRCGSHGNHCGAGFWLGV